MLKVSIIMNCWNGQKYLSQAISSVISQTYQNWELVFWDNKSTDDSKEIFLSFKDKRLKYHLAPKFTKLFKARNLAVSRAKGDYIAFLDTDDYWMNTKLETQLRFINIKNSDISFTKYIILDENKNKFK